MSEAEHKREVGSRLRIAIESLGLRPTDVAVKFNVSQQKLGNWLRGDHYPSSYFIKRFCERYPKITADWIYLGRFSSALGGDVADTLWAATQASEQAEPAVAGRVPETKTKARRR